MGSGLVSALPLLCVPLPPPFLQEIEGSFQVARISCDCLEEGYEDPDGDWSRTLRDCGVRYFDTIVVVEEIMVRYRGGRKRMCDSKKKMKGATASKKMSRDLDSSECSSSSDSDCDEEECEEDEIEEEGSGDGAVKVRQNFDPLAVLRAVALTDAQGCARIEFGTPGFCFPLPLPVLIGKGEGCISTCTTHDRKRLCEEG